MLRPPLTEDEAIRLAALHSTGQLDTPIEKRFENITRTAADAFDVPISAVSLVDTDRQFFKSICGLNVQGTSRDVSFCGHTILTRDPLVVTDARQDPRFADNPLVTGEPGIRFYAGCPVTVADTHVASLCVIDRQPRQPTVQQLRVLKGLARIAEQFFDIGVQRSVSLDLIGQLREEQRKALIDPLTRVWNRAGIEDLISRQIGESRESGDPIGVIAIDIDHFKNINDTYGHPAGDDVLGEVTRRFLAGVRQGDCVGRQGGEEFLVLLNGCTGVEHGLGVAERLREHVARAPVPVSGTVMDMTVSLGVCVTDYDDELTVDKLFAAADDALYRAKESGRNRVCLAKPLNAAQDAAAAA